MTCNICCNDINGDLIGCKVCSNGLCYKCYEKVLKYDNNRFFINCPYCRSCENANIDNISKPYLFNKILELDKQISKEREENDLLRFYILQIDEEREDLKTKLKKMNDIMSNRIYLRCEYKNKDDLKKMGGRWDAERKLWYIDKHIKNKNEILNKYRVID